MENNRDDILNELIKYYDGDSEPKSGDTAEEKAKEQEMDDTRVIMRKPAVPLREEKLGNTITVNVSKAPEETGKTSDKATEKTPVLGETQNVSMPKTRPQPVIEEVLGNLDITGKPIDRNHPKSPEPETRTIKSGYNTETVPQQRRNTNPAKSTIHVGVEEQDELKDVKKRSGVWYAAKPLWVTLIICAVIVSMFQFYITDTGIIGTYKRNFNNNMRHIFNMFGVEWNSEDSIGTVTKAEPGPRLLADGDNGIIMSSGYTEKDNVKESAPSEYKIIGENKSVIPFADADNSDFAAFKDGVVCASGDKICYINKKGEKEWSHDISVANPIVSARGNYIAIGSNGGTKLSLYKKNKLIYSVDVPNKVRSLVVSEKGDTVLITEKTAYKGSVALVNKKGELVFSWSSGTNYITAASILNNRKIAVSLASTDKRVTSYVMMFDIKSTEPASGVELQDSLIYGLETDGKNVMANGDNCVAMITSDSDVKYDNRFDDVSLTHSANDNHGYRVITYTRDNVPIMNVYDKKGKNVDSRDIEATPDFVAIDTTTVLYNNGRDVICGNISDNKKTLYTAPREIKKLIIIDTKSYMIVYEDGLEIIRI